MVSGVNFASRDVGSASDPYLVLKCNKTTFSERDNYQLDEPCPDFYKKYEFEGTFPGCSPLVIEAWDYDDIFGDDLIGSTAIDLEDRFFSMEWQSLAEKPIECRKLYHPASSMGQGVVKLWATIVPANAEPGTFKTWEIAPKPLEEFEVRVCVLNCKDVPMMDIEGTTDAFVKGYFDSREEVQETDTHYRCTDGKPDFEYRLVYRIKFPRKDYSFTLQTYDRDFFKSNDIIGEATVDLKELLSDSSLTKKPLALNKKYYEDVLKGSRR